MLDLDQEGATPGVQHTTETFADNVNSIAVFYGGSKPTGQRYGVTKAH